MLLASTSNKSETFNGPWLIKSYLFCQFHQWSGNVKWDHASISFPFVLENTQITVLLRWWMVFWFPPPPHHLCSQVIFILHLYRREFSLSASPVKQSYWKAWVKEIVRSEQLDLYLLIATVTCPNLYKRVYYCLTVTFKNMVSKMKTWVTNWGGKK